MMDIDTEATHQVRSPEWYSSVLRQALGYKSLKNWQLSRTMDLCSGKDVFLVVGTGEGKSFLIQAPVIADHAAGRHSMGLVLVPTKALADDQVSQLNIHLYQIKTHQCAGASSESERNTRAGSA
jgi:superfamily II DNA helicase RecQ